MATSSPTLKPESTSSGSVRSIGFPRSSQSMPTNSDSSVGQRSVLPTPQSRPTPKKPAKGRFFIATVLLSVIASLCFILWNELVRYAAYGTVEARIIPIACPWSGIIEQILVEDGQQVCRGQLLAKINSAELQIRLAKISDDIRLAEAALATRVGEMKSRQHELEIQRTRAQAELDQLHSQLHSETAKLNELKVQNQAITQLEYRGVVPEVEASQSSAAYEGQLRRVRSLEQAIGRYKVSLDNLSYSNNLDLNPSSDETKLETLVKERERLIQYQLLGEIRSPIDGLVSQVAHWSGEFVELGEPLFEIIEQGSLRAVLYVRQSSANRYSANQSLSLLLPPNRQSGEFIIERLDDETSFAPANLSRYFRKDERLVRVITKPKDDFQSTQSMKPIWIGAEVRMPHHWLGFTTKSGSVTSTLAKSPE